MTFRPIERKKHSHKKCKHCKFWNDGWCDIFYSRHSGNVIRCKSDYEPKNFHGLWLIFHRRKKNGV